METTLTNPVASRKFISDGVLGMIFLLTTEAMLFAGFISAYIVNHAGATMWPPADQPRLPIGITAINTIILLASGFLLFFFSKNFKSNQANGKNGLGILMLSMLLGLTFVSIQGIEWVRLIGYGLTTSSSLYASFFYLIIGFHGLHVLVGLAILAYLFNKVKNSKSTEDAKNTINACKLYWYFVVGIWPLLYYLVYLS